MFTRGIEFTQRGYSFIGDNVNRINTLAQNYVSQVGTVDNGKVFEQLWWIIIMRIIISFIACIFWEFAFLWGISVIICLWISVIIFLDWLERRYFKQLLRYNETEAKKIVRIWIVDTVLSVCNEKNLNIGSRIALCLRLLCFLIAVIKSHAILWVLLLYVISNELEKSILFVSHANSKSLLGDIHHRAIKTYNYALSTMKDGFSDLYQRKKN